MKELTAKQQEYLDYIKAFMRKQGIPPAIRDLSDHFDVAVRTSYGHIKALENHGYIKTRPETTRGIIIIDSICAYCGNKINGE